jgi:hypothetical protein
MRVRSIAIGCMRVRSIAIGCMRWWFVQEALFQSTTFRVPLHCLWLVNLFVVAANVVGEGECGWRG